MKSRGTVNSKDSEYVIIATQYKKNQKNSLDQYKKRWEIETLFGCLKSRGFNFEDTHMTDAKKISKLLALLTIAFCWARLTGEWLNIINPIKLKKHGRKEKSVFRYGLDYLRRTFINSTNDFKPFLHAFELLSCT